MQKVYNMENRFGFDIVRLKEINKRMGL